MSWAAKRKLIYFCIFILVVGTIIAVPIYSYFHQTATCTDNKQNQGEQGVDCGGPCINLCKPLELAPVVLWQQTFQVVPGTYTAVAYVENPNINGEAFSVPYTFTLYNATNTVIATKTGTTFIPAGRNFAIEETNIQIPNNVPVRTLFEFNSDISWKVARTLPLITVGNVISHDVTTSPEVTADVTNSSLKNVGKVIIAAIVYDSDGNAFAASRTILNSIPAQSTEHIAFTWPLPFTHAVSHIDILPVVQ